MALPRGATGSLRPTFVSARAVALAVRRACAFALAGPMSDRPEPTIARLRYHLGGDRSSQTVPQAGFRAWLTGPGYTPESGRVVFQGGLHEGWFSNDTATPEIYTAPSWRH